MTINEAIDISWGADRYRGVPRPTVEEALERIEHQLATCGFNWLTGQEVRDVLRRAVARPITKPDAESPEHRESA